MDDHPQSRNSPEPLGGFAQHSGLPSVRKTARQRLFGNTLPAQRIEGTVRVQFLAQSLDAGNPATWALGMWLVSPDGHTALGELIPFGIGAKPFSLEGLRPYVVGPLVISPLAAPRRSRILIELGSAGGDARIELDPDEWVLEFEPAIEDNGPHPLQSRHVGRCIYCGAAADLSREHIVPEGLNGEWTLHKASCPRCRDVTSRFETDVLKNAFGCVRVSLNMRTKHPENRPRQLPVRVKRGRAECDLFIDVADYPTIMNSPVFDPPGSVPIAQGGMRIRRENGVWIRQVAGPPLAEVLQGIARKNGYDYVGLRLGYQPICFGRAIAKIAYGLAVLQLGLDAIGEAYVVPAILGNTVDLARWVGCDTTPAILPTTGLHAFQVEVRSGEIHVFVRLFAQFEAPEYHVIVGQLKA